MVSSNKSVKWKSVFIVLLEIKLKAIYSMQIISAVSLQNENIQTPLPSQYRGAGYEFAARSELNFQACKTLRSNHP